MRLQLTYSKVLKYIGIPLQFLGLTSIAEGFFEWKGFFANLLSNYEAVRDFLFSWMPMTIPSNLQDYLVVGFGLAICVFKITIPFNQISKSHPDASRHIGVAIFDITLSMLLFLLWPLAIFLMLLNFYNYVWASQKMKTKIDPANLPTKAERRAWNKIPHLRGRSRNQLIAFGENYLIILILMVVSIFLFSDFNSQ